jgi:PncC family amidohydrolase
MDTELFAPELLTRIKDLLTARKEALAVAESVTAGYLQAALATAEEALQFFQGGITTYNLIQKMKHLQVEPIHAASVNCVSEQVAREMAVHVTRLFNCSWGIAITGYASPVPEQDIFDLYAYIAVAYNNECLLCKKITTAANDPTAARLDYTNQTLKQLAAVIASHERPFAAAPHGL